MFDADSFESSDFIKTHIYAAATLLKRHADELMDMYIKLREATEVEQTPMSLAMKKVFDESEREGTHRKLLFAFHVAAYELHNAASQATCEDQIEIAKLVKLAAATNRAFEKLRKSGKRHVKLAKAAAAAAKAQN